MFDRCQLLDIQVHRVSLQDTVKSLIAFVESGRPNQVVTVNMDFIRLAHSDEQFCDAVNRAELAVPDGMPVLWLSRVLGQPLPERITGIDIMECGASIAAERGFGIFLLGAEPGVAEQAASSLAARHPGLHIAGTYAPPFGEFSAAEDARMVAAVQAARPHMLFVAFGAPRQDVWIALHRDDLGVPVCVGVGGAFNFLAGRIPRAPRWLQRAGLEWAYRLVHEPRRLWRRYLLGDLPIFLRIVSSRLVRTSK